MKFAFVFAAALTAVLGYASVSSAAPDPTNEKAAVPAVRYQSPFRDYRPLGDDTRIPWKAANDEVGRIGGWRAYAKEAREMPTTAPVTDKTPPGASAPSGKPLAEPAAKLEPGHAGHGQAKEEQKK